MQQATRSPWWGPASRPLGNAVSLRADQWLAAALVLEIVAAAFEGPLRMALNAVRLDSLIFLRDLFLLLTLCWFVLARAFENRLPGAVLVFAIALLCHSAVSLINLGAPVAVVYGLKLALPLLAGYLAPQALFSPGRGVLRIYALLLVASVGGAVVDVLSDTQLPWVGVTTTIGGIDVQLARDWQSGAIKRVGGLARYSNCLAVVLSLLTLVLLGHTRSAVLRALMMACTLLVLVWTTQKGAILGFAFTALAWVASGPQRGWPLRLGVVLAVFFAVLAPILLTAMPPPSGQGVFSLESFAERIRSMWPDAWRWIDQYSMLAGVGLGGIGGAQRFYAPLSFNAADNLFLFLYGNCGILAVAYLLAAAVACACAPLRDSRDRVALASAVFLFCYGIVLSLVEDQIAALWLGASVGWLVASRSRQLERALNRP